MRWGLLVLVLVGCGKVQTAAIDAQPVDAVPDAAEPLTLTSAMGPVELDAEGASGSVAVHVHTLAPAQAVNVMFTSSLGATYTPATVTVTSDANGNATAASTYTSNMAGMEMTSIAGSIASTASASATVTFPVVALQRYGNPTAFTTSGGLSPNFLLGQKITVAATGHLKAFGFISTSVGPSIQIGLYRDAGNAPGALVAELPATAIQNGVNEVQVAPLQLDAGDYWFEAVYNGNGGNIGVEASSGSTIDYISFTFGGTLPATFPTPTSFGGSHYNYYLVVGQ